ncbi:hypothetical protein PC119_g23463 [Phytophthora cactorum]|nr:hypothetical protein PC111_g21178 [Phytophthora cactorum]KAG2876924.1 hypothetical protein PC114_g23925 [Phytophthora cactorum]KAG2971153.1 hypothetical protein PC119_g23463 [Phytophthora cactorum]
MQDEAFDKVKELLTTKPILKYPNFQLSFRVETDASHVELGARLMQDDGDGWQPTAYANPISTDGN